MMPAPAIGRDPPSRFVQPPVSSCFIVARMAATSSGAVWALPSCGTGTQNAPACGNAVPLTR